MYTLEQLQQNSVAMSNNINEIISKHQADRRERVIISAMTGIVASAGLFQLYCIINAILSY